MSTARDRAADQLLAFRGSLADAALGRLDEAAIGEAGRQPSGEGGARARCREDIAAHVGALAAALRAASDAQFGEYCAFTAVFLEGIGVPRSALGRVLDALDEAVGEQLDPALSAAAQEALRAGRRRVDASPLVTPAALSTIPDAARGADGEDASAAKAMERAAPRIAAMSVALGYMRRPGDALTHGARRAHCLEDARRHVAQLAAAVDVGAPALFGEYVDWTRTVLGKLGLDPAELVSYLGALSDAVAVALPAHLADAPRSYIAAALDRITSVQARIPSYLDPAAPLGALAQRYLDAICQGDRAHALQLILDAVEAPTPIKDIYVHVFQPVLYEVGRLWQLNRMSIAEEHYCTAVTQVILSQLYPLLFGSDRAHHRIVAAAVDGNLHELGARFVADFFEMAGWDTFYLGASTPADHVVREVVHRKADVLAVSASISEHLPGVGELIAAARGERRCRDVVLLVGGRPFSVVHDLWRQLGADGWAPTADGAVSVAERLLAAQSR